MAGTGRRSLLEGAGVKRGSTRPRNAAPALRDRGRSRLLEGTVPGVSSLRGDWQATGERGRGCVRLRHFQRAGFDRAHSSGSVAGTAVANQGGHGVGGKKRKQTGWRI